MLQRSLHNSLSCRQLLQQRTAFAASLHPSLGAQCQARHAVCAASRSKAAVQRISTSTESSAAVAEPSRGFLDTLSEEQKAPVYAQEQHIRVIAGELCWTALRLRGEEARGSQAVQRHILNHIQCALWGLWLWLLGLLTHEVLLAFVSTSCNCLSDSIQTHSFSNNLHLADCPSFV